MPNSDWTQPDDENTGSGSRYDRPSKSQKKRDMTALQKLGQQLVEAPAERVRKIQLPDNLREAIDAWRSIKTHEGKRRQLQFIGKLMRKVDDADIQLINEALDGWRGQSKAQTALLHSLERQRQRLLTEDGALTEFLREHPQTDAQHLRTLIRNAKKELAEERPPRAYREIFQILKKAQAQSLTPDDAEDDNDQQ